MRTIRNAALALAALLLAAQAVPAQQIEREKPTNPVVVMTTNFGEVFIELFPEEAPKTTANFIGLATGERSFTEQKTGKEVRRPFYDGLTFHRVIKNFMIQGGDPKGDGTGGPGYRFANEINADALGLDKLKVLENDSPHVFLGVRSKEDFQRTVVGPLLRAMGIRSEADLEKRMEEARKRLNDLTLKEAYKNMGYRFDEKLASRAPAKGVLAMANAGPNSNGSQFFINLIDTPWLAGKHTVFGKVVRGMDVIERIGETPVGAGSAPREAVRIVSIRLLKR